MTAKPLNFNTCASSIITNKMAYSTNRIKPFKLLKDTLCGICDKINVAKELVALKFSDIINKY